MSRRSMYFGTRDRMAWVACPAVERESGAVGWSESGTYLNGGAFVARSKGSHRVHEMAWNMVSRKEAGKIESFASGVYGDGPYYWIDPMAADHNVLPTNWAYPAQELDTGVPLTDSTLGTFVTTPAGNDSLPLKSMQYVLPTGSVGKKLWVPIPPGHTLHFGAYGSTSGSGTVFATPYGRNGSVGARTPTQLADPSGNVWATSSWSGDVYAGVEFDVGSAGTPMRNLVTNPAMVATSGTVHVRRNLATNPAMVATSGTVEVRRNLNLYPNRSASSTGWGGRGGVNAVPAPESNATDYRFPESLTTTESIISGFTAAHRTRIEAGQSVVVAWDLENLSPHPVDMRHLVILYRDDDTTNWALSLEGFSLAAGERRVVAYETPANEQGGTLRLDIRHGSSESDRSPLPGTVIRVHDGLTIEAPGTFKGTTFSGSLPSPDPDLTASWVGSENASESVLTGLGIAGVHHTTTNIASNAYQTSDGLAPGEVAARFVIQNAVYGNLPVTAYSATVGATYTLKVRIRASRDLTAVRLRLGGSSGDHFSLPADEWVEVTHTGVASSTHSATFGIFLSALGGHQVGDEIDVRLVMLTEGEYNGPYIDGSITSPDPDLTLSWVGAENASESVLTGQRVENINSPTADQVAPAFRATGGPEGSTHYARFRVHRRDAIAFPTGNVSPPTGQLSTLLAWVRAPRDYTRVQMRISGAYSGYFDLPANEWVQKRFTTEAGTGSASPVTTGFRFDNNGGHQPGDLIDVALVMLTEGEYFGDYRDGNSPGWAWEGPANSSTSTEVGAAVTLSGMVAQVLPNGRTPLATGWLDGLGTSGAEFEEHPERTDYSSIMDKVGLTATLIEVGTWL